MKAWLVALANALFPGIGYIILRKRFIFGLLLAPGSIMGWYAAFTLPVPEVPTVLAFAALISSALAALAFGYDAYTLAKE